MSRNEVLKTSESNNLLKASDSKVLETVSANIARLEAEHEKVILNFNTFLEIGTIQTEAKAFNFELQ